MSPLADMVMCYVPGDDDTRRGHANCHGIASVRQFLQTKLAPAMAPEALNSLQDEFLLESGCLDALVLDAA